jgi:hypothetical protein
MEPGTNTTLRTVLVALLLLLVGLGVYAYFDRERVSRWFAGDIIESDLQKETQLLEEKIVSLEDEVATLKEELEAESATPEIPDARLKEAFGVAPEGATGEKAGQPAVPWDTETAGKDQGQILRERLTRFCNYLDGRDYVASYGLKGGIYEHFQSLLPALLAKPPAVVRETDDLLRVLQNSAHFYRVLGKQNLYLIRDIIRNERDLMEPVLGLCYQIIESGKLPASGDEHGEGELQIPLSGAYEYAAFFLNTLGGGSYLIRRDSRVRMLTQYYAMRILDMAEQRRLNRWGLDIRQPLEILISDMQGTSNLAQKRAYLRTLRAMQKQYAEQYGG